MLFLLDYTDGINGQQNGGQTAWGCGIWKKRSYHASLLR